MEPVGVRYFWSTAPSVFDWVFRKGLSELSGCLMLGKGVLRHSYLCEILVFLPPV